MAKRSKPIDYEFRTGAIAGKENNKRGNAYSPAAAKGAEGYNQQNIDINTRIFNLPVVSFNDTNAVQERINEYFGICREYDKKPTFAGLCLALGISRNKFIDIIQGKGSAVTIELSRIFEKTHVFMNALWEDYMLNGKVNPASGIYLGKNDYGYKEVVEHTFSTSKDDTSLTVDEIKKRYLGPDKLNRDNVIEVKAEPESKE